MSEEIGLKSSSFGTESAYKEEYITQSHLLSNTA